jgi:hypothetical protein
MHEIQQIKRYFAFDGLELSNDVQHTAGYTMWLKHDLPVTLQITLRALPAEYAFHDHDAVIQMLAAYAPCKEVWQGIGYLFPQPRTPVAAPEVVRLTEAHRELIEQYASGMIVDKHAVFGIIADRRLVATCESSRENELGGEAWVQTLPEYRSRGYARQTTAAWAHNLQAQHKTPYYNQKHTNTASQALARSLGLQQFMADVSYR